MAASRTDTAATYRVFDGADGKPRCVRVQHRSLRQAAPQPAVRITLPSPRLVPPRLWISRAIWDVRLKHFRRVRGRVRVSIAFGRDPGGRLDVLARAVVDLLTATNRIDGDGPQVLKELTLRWGIGDDVQILIEPWSPSAMSGVKNNE